MKSETANEDIDQNGSEGDMHTVRVRAIHNGRYYDLGSVETSQTSSTCDDGTDTGSVDLSLDDSTVLSPEVCDLEVDVELLDGTIPPNGSVFAYDGSVPSEVWQELCLDESNSFICSYTGQIDANGRATISTPVLTGLYLWASSSDVNPEAEDSFRTGTRSVTSCPSQPITMTLNSGYDWFDVAINVSGNQITWTPSVGVNWLTVANSDGNSKWSLTGTPDTFDAPVTYATVPEGARQYWPWDGSSPESLATGDEIGIYGTKVTDEGYSEIYSGEGIVE
jgi:hypothetical protein